MGLPTPSHGSPETEPEAPVCPPFAGASLMDLSWSVKLGSCGGINPRRERRDTPCFSEPAIPFVVGVAIAVMAGLTTANNGLARNQQIACAHERVPKAKSDENIFDKFDDVILKGNNNG